MAATDWLSELNPYPSYHAIRPGASIMMNGFRFSFLASAHGIIAGYGMGGRVMGRRIEFLERTYWESNGRNGEMQSRGVYVSGMPRRAGEGTDEACIRVVTSRGIVSDSARVVFPAEAAGDIAAAVLEHFAAHATPEAREALAARLVAICETGTDPAYAEGGADAPLPPGPRM